MRIIRAFWDSNLWLLYLCLNHFLFVMWCVKQKNLWTKRLEIFTSFLKPENVIWLNFSCDITFTFIIHYIIQFKWIRQLFSIHIYFGEILRHLPRLGKILVTPLCIFVYNERSMSLIISWSSITKLEPLFVCCFKQEQKYVSKTW